MKRLPIFLLLGVTGCHHEPSNTKDAPVRVHCVAPRGEAIDEVLELPGRIEPPPGGDLSIASQVAGRVVEVSAREGQHLTTRRYRGHR